MDLFQFIYGLLKKHLTIPLSQIAQLENEAKDWIEGKGKDTWFGKLFHTYGMMWYTRTGFAVAFVFASRWMYDFMNPVEEEEEDEREVRRR